MELPMLAACAEGSPAQRGAATTAPTLSFFVLRFLINLIFLPVPKFQTPEKKNGRRIFSSHSPLYIAIGVGITCILILHRFVIVAAAHIASIYSRIGLVGFGTLLSFYLRIIHFLHVRRLLDIAAQQEA